MDVRGVVVEQNNRMGTLNWVTLVSLSDQK